MRFARYAAILAALVTPFALAVGSCGLVLDDFQKVPAVGDADAGDTDADAQTGCVSATYPEPPPDDAGDTDAGEVSFTVAVREIELGDTATKEKPIGLNLDNLCTCIGEGASCKYPAFATEDHCDDTGGVDNGAGRLLKGMTALLGEKTFGSVFYSDKAEQGFWTLLLRVSNYNGLLNDPRVTFAIYAPAGLEQSSMDGADAGSAADAGDGGTGPCMRSGDGGIPEIIPCWNGNDVWRVSADSVANMDVMQPLYVDPNAYVSKGFLVANVSETEISLNGTNSHFGVKLTAGTILSSIQKPQADGLGYRLINGIIAARWRTKDLFSGLSTLNIEGQSFCKDNPLYGKLKERLCAFVDISSKLGGATLECDSMSFGMKFNAFPVNLGTVMTVVAPPAKCDEGQDPATDECGK